MATEQNIKINPFTQLASDMNAAVEGFLNDCRSKNLSNETIKYYSYRLLSFRRYIDANLPDIGPDEVTTQLIRAFISDESQQTSPATANHSIVALKAFFNYLVQDGFLDTTPMKGIPKLKCRKTIIDTFTSEQVGAILATCKKDFNGVRDRAIILMLLDCGLRVSELVGLRLGDVSWNDQTMLIVGKGDKERVVPFGHTVRQALVQYLAKRGEHATNAIFISCYGEHIDRFRVREMIEYRCKAAEVTGVRCSPHTFRHTFAVSYLRAGGDVFSLQKILGHTDLRMTRRYCELSEGDVIERHRYFSPADRLQMTKLSSGRKRIK